MIASCLKRFRAGSLSYALSPTTLLGLVRGLPEPRLGTRISPITFSKSVISAGEAESVWLPRGRPLPSTTTMHFVPIPLLWVEAPRKEAEQVRHLLRKMMTAAGKLKVPMEVDLK